MHYQLSFKMSKQMAPVTEDIFGCQILVMNLTCTMERREKEKQKKHSFALLDHIR